MSSFAIISYDSNFYYYLYITGINNTNETPVLCDDGLCTREIRRRQRFLKRKCRRQNGSTRHV